MFDIDCRDGLAKVGKWKLAGKELTTPNILFISSERFNVIPEAEGLIADRVMDDPRFCLLDSGSIFLSRQFEGDNVIPPDLPYPRSLSMDGGDRQASKKEEGVHTRSKGFIAFASGSRPPRGDEAELYVIRNAVEYLDHPRGFAEEIVSLRENVRFHSLAYAPALGEPAHYSLLTYAGIDIMDTLPLIINTRKGFFLTPSGKLHRDEMEEVSCHCPACRKHGSRFDFPHILEHNCYTALSEIKHVRNTIRKRCLRELVEMRVHSNPWLIAVLRHLDLRHYESLEKFLPVAGRELKAMTRTSLTRPEIVRFRKRVESRASKPHGARVLLLLPCSARKPYSSSQSHRLFERTIIEAGAAGLVHEVIVTSPLGLVPKELELFYPAGYYDVPVTGDWDRDEKAIVEECLAHYLKKNRYESIIVHLPKEMGFVRDFIGDCTSTCADSPASSESLGRLEHVLADACRNCTDAKLPDRKERLFENVSNIAVFQFGDAGKRLVDGCEVKGRYPNLKLLKDKRQVAMLTEERGMLSLTLEGGSLLMNERVYFVEIEDFVPKGNVFATGVEDADPQTRIGDDVVVCHKKELRAVGVAVMPQKEMVESKRGEAVRVRHVV